MRLTPKPILVGERLQQLDMLLHIQEFSSMIAVITGGAEMGKTALLELASSQLSVHHQVISFSATAYQSEGQVLAFMSEQLNTEASWSAIEAALAGIHDQSETVNLLIDDAHFLSFELLEIISVRAISEDGWHLALAGDNTLHDSLIKIQTDLHHSNIIHHIDLIAISAAEALDLAEAYFKSEGLSSVPVSAQKIDHLWKLAEGVPGKLIDLFEREKEQKTIEASKFPVGHVASICLIAIALSFSYFYKDEPIDDLDSIELIIAEAAPVKLPESEGGADTKLAVVDVNKAPADSTLAVKENSDINSHDQSTKKESMADLAPSVVVNSTVENTLKQNDPETSKKVAAIEKPLIKASRQIPHPLLAAPSNGFALQLLGVRSRASAEKVMDDFKQALGSNDLSVYETKYKGQPWFVVVYGPINNQKKARQKAGSIAKALNNQPWIRPMAKIQEDIRKIQP